MNNPSETSTSVHTWCAASVLPVGCLMSCSVTGSPSGPAPESGRTQCAPPCRHRLGSELVAFGRRVRRLERLISCRSVPGVFGLEPDLGHVGAPDEHVGPGREDPERLDPTRPCRNEHTVAQPGPVDQSNRDAPTLLPVRRGQPFGRAAAVSAGSARDDILGLHGAPMTLSVGTVCSNDEGEVRTSTVRHCLRNGR